MFMHDAVSISVGLDPMAGGYFLGDRDAPAAGTLHSSFISPAIGPLADGQGWSQTLCSESCVGMEERIEK